MLAWIHDHRPALIVECGSGASTVLFGYQVQRVGAGKVISLEHDPLYATRTRELARQHDVEDVIEVRDAPLQTWQEPDGVWQWYNRAAIEDITEIDLLFVDGPPGATGHLARFPAGPLLFGKLAAAGVAVLDDALRDDEKRTSELWLERMEWLERERLKTEKGTDIFRRRAGT
jgi:predicted O-methyltransferase YrrM